MRLLRLLTILLTAILHIGTHDMLGKLQLFLHKIKLWLHSVVVTTAVKD